jgi:hypothetical protein
MARPSRGSCLAPTSLLAAFVVGLAWAPAAAAQADPDRLEEPAGLAPDDPADDAGPRLAPPSDPSVDELRALVQADPRVARPLLRRAARTASDASERAVALLVLARVDPTRATARICSRALRIDPAVRARRAAAECLGRLPPVAAAPQTPALVAALEDESLDVMTMVGWAPGNAGDAAATGPVTALTRHEDPRVARLFFEYTQRLRSRHGAPLEPAEREGAARLVPPPDALVSQGRGLEATTSTAWLALYGAMSGWLHGGLFPAAHGGTAMQPIVALTALGGAVAGAAAGGAYGFFRADRLVLAHNVVQVGAFGTLVGYGAGLLSGPGPQVGINMASFGAAGAIAGTGIAVVMNEVVTPTPGALALGAAAGLGAATSAGALAVGYSLPPTAVMGSLLLLGGATGALTTILVAPYDVGLLPIVGATVGGLGFATAAAVTFGIVEAVQIQGQPAGFTPGAGWVVAGSYALGAVTGAALGLVLPGHMDPFLASGLRLALPSLSILPDVVDPRRTLTLAQLGGTF